VTLKRRRNYHTRRAAATFFCASGARGHSLDALARGVLGFSFVQFIKNFVQSDA
jgi:hypothetical protein